MYNFLNSNLLSVMLTNVNVKNYFIIMIRIAFTSLTLYKRKPLQYKRSGSINIRPKMFL